MDKRVSEVYQKTNACFVSVKKELDRGSAMGLQMEENLKFFFKY